MRLLVLVVLFVGSFATWAMLTVPGNHGQAALAAQTDDRTAECLIEQVNDKSPRRTIGPWAIEQTSEDPDRYRVFGAFGQSWEFWRSEGTLSTTGVRNTTDFGTSSCS